MTAPKSLAIMLVLIFTTIAQISAQTPGYLGKKTTVQFHFLSGPNISGPTANNKAWNNGYIGFRGVAVKTELSMVYKWGSQIDRTIGRLTNVFVSFDNYTTGMTNTLDIEVDDLNSNNSSIWSSISTFQQVRAREANIGIKFFSNSAGAIAPMGSYFATSLGYGQYRTSIEDHQRKDNSIEGEDFRLRGYGAKYNMILLGLEAGANYVFLDRFLLNLNLNANIPYIDLLRISENDFFLRDVSSAEVQVFYNDKRQRYTLANRVANHNLLMFTIGVGYLF